MNNTRNDDRAKAIENQPIGADLHLPYDIRSPIRVSLNFQMSGIQLFTMKLHDYRDKKGEE